MAAPADVHTLILSDVLGDDLSAIASGPTVADSSTFIDALKVIQDKKLDDRVPQAVQKYLRLGRLGKIKETPKPNNPAFEQSTQVLIASNGISLRAITQAAQHLNYTTIIYSEQLTGEARLVAEELVLYAQKLIERGLDQPCAILAGGEATVTITGTGLGGRNQEMALAFTIAAEKYSLKADWVFLSGGTDGCDGPTNAAGGLVDAESLTRMHKAGIDAEHYLANNDSYHALQISEDLLITGATGTNVADLQILLIQSKGVGNK